MARPRSLRDQRLHPDDWQFRSLEPWRGIRPAGIARADKFFHRAGHRVSGHDWRQRGAEFRLRGLTVCESCGARFYVHALPGWLQFWCGLTDWEAHEIGRQVMAEDEIMHFLRLDTCELAQVGT